MKKFVRRFATKKYLTLLAIAIVIAACVGIFVLLSVQKNLKLMNAHPTETNYATYPALNTAGRDAALVQRGEYLAKAGDCIACHTNTLQKGIAYAGGLPMHTPFGTIYSPNITPDKETGIGNWTEEQFIKAMREGISPQGHYYFPAFPYYYFNRVKDEDLKALKAYLDSLPPIKQANKKNEMMMPFNIRFLQLGWRMLFFRGQNTGAFQEDPSKSTEWNRGAYLVQGLGHCGMCHTPSHHLISESIPLGAPIKKYDLSGAPIQGYLAPNISKKNLETASIDEVVNVFLKDEMIGGGKIKGPMLEVNHNSLRYLSREDLVSIATYLKSVESLSPPVSTSGGPGAAVYEGYCAGCHAMGAGGAPKMGDKATWDALQKKSSMEEIYAVALHGKGGMPAKGTCLSCSVEEIKQAVDYMIHGEGEADIQAPPSFEKPLSMQDGQRIYNTSCSSCHSSGKDGAPKIGEKKVWEQIAEKGFFDILVDVKTGKTGHPPQGGCASCTDAELKAAVKYLMQQSVPNQNYELW